MAAQVDDSASNEGSAEGLPVGMAANDLNNVVSQAPLAMFASHEELVRELVCLLKGDVGVMTLDRPVERDSRVVITAGIPGELAPGELVFQVKVRGVIMHDGEFGCRATLCDDKSRIYIGRFLKRFHT